MGLLDSFKANKAIDTISCVDSLTSADAIKAMRKIKQAGASVIPKLIQAHERALNPDIINDLLTGYVDNSTLPYFTDALADSDQRIAKNAAIILRQASRYDPNLLIDLFENPDISKDILIDILAAHREKLKYQRLLSMLNKVPASVYPMIFKLVSDMAHVAMLQDLIDRLNHKNPIVRAQIIRIISRFSTEATYEALLKLLQDENKNVRLAALEGLGRLEMPVSAQPICRLLRDGDMTVQSRAIDTISKIRDANTIKYLVEILQDESDYVRRAAVEVLNEVGDENSVKDLLNSLRDKDWWVKVRAADALGAIGGPRVVEGALALIKEDDEFLRRTAVEILNSSKDGRAINHLIEALADEDWWVRERAIDALAMLKDKRAVEPLIKQLGRHTQTSKVAIRALASLGDHSAVEPILHELNTTSDDSVKKEALRALEVLTDEEHAGIVQDTVTQMIDIGSPELRQMASRFQTGITVSGSDEDGDSDETLMLDRSEAVTAQTDASRPATASQANINPMTLGPGQILENRYRVVQRIGKGAMGVVILVVDQAVNEQLVLKFLTRNDASDDSLLERFTQELRFARRITHENVIRIYDFITMQNSHAISMEYFPSHSLADEIANRRLQDTRRTLRLLVDICHGMFAAQSAHVVHRDLKPANILINDEDKVKICDFGISAAASNSDSRLTKDGILIGTPTYMAPEQAHGKATDSRTDIYSLGVIMYEIFTGKAPYEGDSPMATLLRHVEGKAAAPREINPGIPEAVERIILKALATDPGQRFQSFQEMAQQLEQALQEYT